MTTSRTSGVLLHITSLPSRYGIGDLGPEAYRFVDMLNRTNQHLWQVLPICPTGPGASPYSSPSTFAGNPLLISPELLVDHGLLKKDELTQLEDLPQTHVDYEHLTARKLDLLDIAFERFDADASSAERTELKTFRDTQSRWIEDYALYATLKNVSDVAWTDWPAPLAQRQPEALRRAREKHERSIRKRVFWQYLFDRQWAALRDYCQDHEVNLFGDIPIYVAHDSADVWAHQDQFRLDDDGQPQFVAGVPPDYFNPKGQRWGNPLYHWDRMAETGYQWWVDRLNRTFDQFDLVRLDHFRGFDAYWEIPADDPTAVNGAWRDGPGADFFETMATEFERLPIVAEDLGVITDSVRALRNAFDFPGMAVLQFGFEDTPANEYLPHNYRPNQVAYTGTHDNNTTIGWWREGLSDDARTFAKQYLGLSESAANVHHRCIRAVMASVAERVIFPLQDVLGLGAEARMNTPGTVENNWTWRATPEQLSEETRDAQNVLRDFTHLYGRAEPYD